MFCSTIVTTSSRTNPMTTVRVRRRSEWASKPCPIIAPAAAISTTWATNEAASSCGLAVLIEKSPRMDEKPITAPKARPTTKPLRHPLTDARSMIHTRRPAVAKSAK